ncbi:hypothetical protein WR25_17374 [Diploscapter pachys]|uniref:C6 domain-containing protein n=1 Tax=Diploscapter pachys TaxID=2018661 RepID=A0A2A2KWD8_9BILA|nr:hypothetical protein WR25_17374 [Diploscapter pachys]
MKILIVACGLVAVISCGGYRSRKSNYDSNNYAPSNDYNTRTNYNQDSEYNRYENGYDIGGMSIFDFLSHFDRYNNDNEYRKGSSSSESYSSSDSHERKRKCKRCRRVKTTTFTSAPAGIALTASPLQQTTPEIEYSFDNGCKKAIITCPHTPGSTTNFYLLARTDSPLSSENQLPSGAASLAYGKRATAVVECDGKNWKANRLTNNAEVKFAEVSCYADPNPCTPAPDASPALLPAPVPPPQQTPATQISVPPGFQLVPASPAASESSPVAATADETAPASTLMKRPRRQRGAKVAMASPVDVVPSGGKGGKATG